MCSGSTDHEERCMSHVAICIRRPESVLRDKACSSSLKRGVRLQKERGGEGCMCVRTYAGDPEGDRSCGDGGSFGRYTRVSAVRPSRAADLRSYCAPYFKSATTWGLMSGGFQVVWSKRNHGTERKTWLGLSSLFRVAGSKPKSLIDIYRIVTN